MPWGAAQILIQPPLEQQMRSVPHVSLHIALKVARDVCMKSDWCKCALECFSGHLICKRQIVPFDASSPPAATEARYQAAGGNSAWKPGIAFSYDGQFRKEAQHIYS